MTTYQAWLTATWEQGQSFPPNLIRGLRTAFPELDYNQARSIYSQWYQTYGSNHMPEAKFKYRDLVITPLGPGRISARGTDQQTYLVDFFPEHFSAESWTSTFGISPQQVGTGLTRFVPEDQLQSAKYSSHPVITPRGMLQSQPAVQPPTKKGTVPKMNAKTSTPLAEGEFEPGATPGEATAAAVPLIVAEIGLKVRTNRKGDLYEVIKISDDGQKITLNWLEGKYKRDVTPDQLSKGYTIVDN